MSERLSDDDIDDIRRDNGARVGDAYATAAEVHAMTTELRELRALLALPMPCGWDEPRVTSPDAHGVVGVAAEWLGDDVHPFEAIALGAALIAAGLKARGDK